MMRPAPSADLVEALEAENDTLRARIRELEAELMGATWHPPLELALTPHETMVLQRLYARERCSKNDLMLALYSLDASDPPEIKIIDVFVCKLRKKLAVFDLRIETQWGFGYYLAADTRAALDNWGRA